MREQLKREQYMPYGIAGAVHQYIFSQGTFKESDLLQTNAALIEMLIPVYHQYVL